MTDIVKNQVTESNTEQVEKKTRRSKKCKNVTETTTVSTESSMVDTETAVDSTITFVQEGDDTPDPDLELSSQPAPESPIFDTGEAYETALTLLYASSVAPKHFRGIKGKFYIWSNEIVNGRIRLTDSPSGIGNVDRIIGWIKVPNKGD